jgi:hypothetical protein
MGLIETIKRNEQVHNAGRDLKYLLCEKEGSDKLIVSFPGFNTETGAFRYRYVRTLNEVNAHKLFLLDEFGTRGCYLLGKNRDFSVETTVMSLLNTIMKKYNIKIENVIMQGSSKGGWMALYYGIKYRFGYVIAGGPQTKMGDFLMHDTEIVPDEEIHFFSKVLVADYIAGGHEKEDIEYLDNLLFDLLYYSPENFPKIYIHVGKGDFHLEKHILPFTDELDKDHIKYRLDIEEYDEHNDLAYYYPEYLLKTLNGIDKKLITIIEEEIPLKTKNIV